MELLPNYKCLTKIKNHLQLGLIRELIGLLPVGKQWGTDTYTSSYGETTLPLTATNIYFATATDGIADSDFGNSSVGASLKAWRYVSGKLKFQFTYAPNEFQYLCVGRA